MSTNALNTRQLFADVVPVFLKSADVDVPGPVLFDIQGDDGGSWVVDFGARSVTPGPAQGTVKAIVRAHERDFMAFVEGRMSPEDGIMTKRLHLAGEAVALATLMAAFAQLRATL